MDTYYRVARSLAESLGVVTTDSLLSDAGEDAFTQPFASTAGATYRPSPKDMRSARLFDYYNEHKHLALWPQSHKQLCNGHSWPLSNALATGQEPAFDTEPPSYAELVEYEHNLLDLTLQALMSKASTKVMEDLRTDLGFTLAEAARTIRLAYRLAYDYFAGIDQEEHRAVMAMQLNSFVQRCRNALDYTNEIKGIHQLSALLGLHKDKQDDLSMAFADIVKATKSPLLLEDQGHTL